MVTLKDEEYENIRRAAIAKDDKIAALEAEVQWFREQFNLAQRRLYGASTEQTAAILGQAGSLFNEAELTADPEAPELDPEAKNEVAARTRNKKEKGQREALFEGLPVEDVFHNLADDDLYCKTCSAPLHDMGADIRREITIYPPRVVVTHIHTQKAVCDCCQREGRPHPITQAYAPLPAFPKSMASPSSVAFAIMQKYVEGVPLYRQMAGYQRCGLNLSRQTLSNWVIAGADLLGVVYNRMRSKLLSEKVLHADETPLQVLQSPSKTEARMWLYCTGRDGPAIYIYEYQPGRGKQYPVEFLKEFEGWLHTDGYVGYTGIPGVTLSGCWAHARRYYTDALSLLSPMMRQSVNTTARQGLFFCDRLFAVERQIAGLSPQERLAARKSKSQPIIDEYHAWLQESRPNVLPQSPTGKAISYSLNQWVKLTEFLNNGSLEISNNRAERAIKPFVIGRKNWLFCNSEGGAKASSTLYSIIETAKANGIDPFNYLKYLFEMLPNLKWEDKTVDNLMPWCEGIQSKFAIPNKATQ